MAFPQVMTAILGVGRPASWLARMRATRDWGTEASDRGCQSGMLTIERGQKESEGRALNLVEEANELVPVLLHAAADHAAVEHVERREQRRRAVALVVMRHGAAASRLQRQPRLGAVERLDLAFLVD